jgi:hypothetical protein
MKSLTGAAKMTVLSLLREVGAAKGETPRSFIMGLNEGNSIASTCPTALDSDSKLIISIAGDLHASLMQNGCISAMDCVLHAFDCVRNGELLLVFIQIAPSVGRMPQVEKWDGLASDLPQQSASLATRPTLELLPRATALRSASHPPQTYAACCVFTSCYGFRRNQATTERSLFRRGCPAGDQNPNDNPTATTG